MMAILRLHRCYSFHQRLQVKENATIMTKVTVKTKINVNFIMQPQTVRTSALRKAYVLTDTRKNANMETNVITTKTNHVNFYILNPTCLMSPC